MVRPLKRRAPRRTREQRQQEREEWERRLQAMEAWAVPIENGAMRQAVYRHFPLDEDTSDNPIHYEVTVPYLALVVPEDPASPGYPPLPFRVLGYTPNGVPQLQGVREFCDKHGIRFRDCKWSPNQRQFELLGRRRDPYGGTVRILVFETVEDQKTVASAFAGRLR